MFATDSGKIKTVYSKQGKNQHLSQYCLEIKRPLSKSTESIGDQSFKIGAL